MARFRITSAKPIFVLGVVLAASSVAAGAASGDRSVDRLGNHCFALRSLANGKFVGASGPDAYRADRSGKAQAAAFFLKPSALGRFLLQDGEAKLLSAHGPASVGRDDAATPNAVWAVRSGGRRGFTLRSAATGKRLAVAPGTGELVLRGAGAGRRALFDFARKGGCSAFPEAELNATGRPFRGKRGGNVFGFADIHLHITADLRAGGRVLHGKAFDPLGITTALGFDAQDHGPNGGADVTGNLLRSGNPIGNHDTHGWPSFAGWPTFDTNTHQQVYYRWLERNWKAGERLIVAQTVEDEPLCKIEPVRSHSCDETATIKLEVRRLKALERYVDAQSGGPGRGWFRLVRSPRQARRVIERGKLAVVIGAESSNLFGCSEFKDQPQCNRRDIDRGIARAKRLGVRSVFVAHWTDNAFAGAALEGGDKGKFINVFNKLQTGDYFEAGPCPLPGQGEEPESVTQGELQILVGFFPAAGGIENEPVPTYPPGKQCNVKGLTNLGSYLIRRLIANRMLIEVDHMSERARASVLRIAARRHYPLVSSHTGTGGAWTPPELKQLYRLGGIASATPDQASQLADKVVNLQAHSSDRFFCRVPLGTDTGGFSSTPAPRPDAGTNPLPYPFRAFRGNVSFDRQRTGTRTFDLNTDGVAHYGLYADLLADMRRTPNGERASRLLFGSAEAYLRMWQRAVRRR